MKRRLICVLVVFAACLGLTAPAVHAQDGLEGALPRANVAPPANLISFGQTLAVADFDSDHKLDGAVLVGPQWPGGQSSYHIELHLSGSKNTELNFESSETALAITASDVNHDGMPDVVIERPDTHKRLHVWLNDGHGGFHKGRVEDFASSEVQSSAQLEMPDHPAHGLAVCLPQQRGTEKSILASSSLRGRPPSAHGVAASSLNFSPESAALLPACSRAPPLLLS